jgi:hypothetical protein
MEDTDWDTDAEIWATGARLRRQMEALRSVHHDLTPGAAQLDSQTEELFEPALVRVMGPSGLIKVDELIKQLITDAETNWSDGMANLLESLKDEPWGLRAFLSVSEHLRRHKREPIFHAAMLTSVTSSFEAHLALLAGDYFHASPKSLKAGSKEDTKEFSLEDLWSLGSVSAAVEAAIDARIEKLTFGSISDWRLFFEKRVGLPATAFENWDALAEIFERRNCVVHHSGRASARYERFVNGKIKRGTPLVVDASYVTQSIDTLESTGLLLALEVWTKFSEDSDVIQMFVDRIGFETMKRHRWSVALAVNEAHYRYASSESSRRTAQVNIWLATKHLEGLRAIQADVEQWDLSATSGLYHLAKSALLEEIDTCFELLPDLLARGELTGEALATWPLLVNLRADPRIEDHKELMIDYLADLRGEVTDEGNTPDNK